MPRICKKESGSEITLTSDVKEGTKGADVIYTDVFILMRLILRIIGQKSWVRKTVFMEHFCGRSSGGWKREKRPCGNPPKGISIYMTILLL